DGGLDCDDGNDCTDDSCISGACVHTNNTKPCGDGDRCTHACQNGTCTESNPVVCTASDQCHLAGTCDPATGRCSNPNAPDGTACKDGNACTTSETCRGGVCVGGPPPLENCIDKVD